MKQAYSLTDFPPRADLQTVPVLKALATARAALGELNGRATPLPNPTILIDTLFFTSASLEKVKELDYVLSPGRYVGLAETEGDFDFEERFAELKARFKGQVKE